MHNNILSLKRTNLLLAASHLLLAIVIGVIVFPNDLRIDLQTRSHTLSRINGVSNWESIPGTNNEWVIKYGLVFFYTWTAIAHTVYAIDPKHIYSQSLKSHVFPLRWIEYAVSATVMLAIMALVSGVKDAQAYSLLLFMSVTIMATGYWYETTKTKLPIIVGFMLLIGISLTIITCFNERLNNAKDAGFQIPNFVYGVVYMMLTFYGIFGFVPLLPQHHQEKAYMGLSLIAKTSLGVFLAIGATRPQM